LVFASKYHSIAAISALIDWILSKDPEPPEVMAWRITSIRKLNFSDIIFGPGNSFYAIEEP